MRILRNIGLLIASAALLSACAIVHSKPDLPQRADVTPGSTITVNGNQNVYSVARQNNVSMRDLIVLNNLQPPYTLAPGQTLTLPSATSAGGTYLYGNGSASTASPTNYGGNFHNGYAPTPASSPSPAIETQSLPPIETKPIQSQPLPASKFDAQPVPAPTSTKGTLGTLPAKSSPVEALNQPTAPAKPVATTATPAKTNVVTEQPPAAPVATPTSVPSTTMLWPVQGPILSAFGPKGQGLNNDGINIGAPKGAPVVAAQNGIVVYAGNEMKGFGNLVLIRHKDGWVTAYAHLDRTLVSKDGVVAQGDEIGTVGKTGNVPSPQLHFETRYEGKPVDPATIIKAQ
ncbi:MAG TPA: peptidoglycan DD-metalloendopeptidase family protein [Alphaproteobacteria bacterium]|nr:peptidoglycan DD-metalloendopeptidase family protein [Alphaproteobacteria bacterium]